MLISLASLLTQHMLAHTGEKRMLCSAPGRLCVSAHRIMSAVAHLCPHCDTKSFARTSNLYRHMRTCKGLLMSGENPGSGDSPTLSRGTTPRPASPTSQACLTEDLSALLSAPVTSETIPSDPSSVHASIRSWKRRTYTLPNTNRVSLPIAQRFYVQNVAFYKTITSAAALSYESSHSSPPNSGLSPPTPAYRTANRQEWDIPALERAPSTSLWAPTTPESYKLNRIPPPSNPSLPVAQSVYVRDAGIYKAIIEAANATLSPPSRSTPSPYSTLGPWAGAAPQNNAYTAGVAQGWLVIPWEHTLTDSSGLCQHPAQYQTFNDAAPPQTAGEQGGVDFWGDSAAQGWEIVASSEHDWLSRPSETHRVSYAPAGAGKTSPTPKQTPASIPATRDDPLILELPHPPVYPIPDPPCPFIANHDLWKGVSPLGELEH